ncbi:MAG: cardiolipin synthase [Eubacteriales bacterium]
MKFFKRILNRLTIVCFALLIQLVWLFFILFYAGEITTVISILLKVLSVLVIAHIINSPSNPSVKLAWIVPILIFPLFGGVIYLLFGVRRNYGYLRKKYEKADRLAEEQRRDDSPILTEIAQIDQRIAGQCRYLSNSGFPVHTHTAAEYFPLGDDNFPVLVEELKKAKRFIFMEYFIIEDGEMWNSILDVLKEKSAQGVDVRLMYDDMGCILKLDKDYDRYLEQCGIKCVAFNRFRPFLSVVMNNRDHRKITVIDGDVGFTGGINLADEYINKVTKFGHWKDTGIMLKGEAVRNLTLLFLNQWNAMRQTDESFEPFMPTEAASLVPSDGYVQPYGDSPLDFEICAENVYLNIINHACRYLYIFTPYLIIDNETVTALTLAAKRGVDVRIITPAIPDKKIVFQLTRSYYPELIKHGVKIYEYTPGFVHAKSFVCDDEVATVGSVNLDFRSLYHHFECGCYLYKSSVVQKVREDFEQTLQKSAPVKHMTIRVGLFRGLWYAILRLFSPLF